MKTMTTAVPVTERALVMRINRQLAKDRERLGKNRSGSRGEFDFGTYYVIRFGYGGSEPSTNIIQTHVDLEDLGRELNVLAQWEEVR